MVPELILPRTSFSLSPSSTSRSALLGSVVPDTRHRPRFNPVLIPGSTVVPLSTARYFPRYVTYFRKSMHFPEHTDREYIFIGDI